MFYCIYCFELFTILIVYMQKFLKTPPFTILIGWIEKQVIYFQPNCGRRCPFGSTIWLKLRQYIQKQKRKIEIIFQFLITNEMNERHPAPPPGTICLCTHFCSWLPLQVISETDKRHYMTLIICRPFI